MRIIVTGAAGFVGPHFVAAVQRRCGLDVRIVPTALKSEAHPILGAVRALDVTDGAAIMRMVDEVRPTHIVNLAGISVPMVAMGDPALAWRVHLHATLDLARAVQEKAPECWLIHVGSGLVYGESASSGRELAEDTLLAPLDEYAVTKAAADLALGALARRGLKCVRFRPFNHTGPGQSEDFFAPAVAMQLARIKAGLVPPVVRVGNLDAERDFLDVRDVALAYALAVERSADLEPGIVLNVASGVPRRTADTLRRLVELSGLDVQIEQDPARLRPSDLRRIVGDASRLRKQLGWQPQHSFDSTLRDLLEYCRARVRGA